MRTTAINETTGFADGETEVQRGKLESGPETQATRAGGGTRQWRVRLQGIKAQTHHSIAVLSRSNILSLPEDPFLMDPTGTVTAAALG